MTWGTRGRAQHSIEAVLGTCFGEPVLPCLMDFGTFSYFNVVFLGFCNVFVRLAWLACVAVLLR